MFETISFYRSVKFIFCNQEELYANLLAASASPTSTKCLSDLTGLHCPRDRLCVVSGLCPHEQIHVFQSLGGKSASKLSALLSGLEILCSSCTASSRSSLVLVTSVESVRSILASVWPCSLDSLIGTHILRVRCSHWGCSPETCG